MTTEPANLAETFVRYGPGVPMPATTDRATAIWRGDDVPEREAEDPELAARRRNQRWILPLTVLILVIAVLIYYFFGRDGSVLTVSHVGVQSSAGTIGCGGTERLTGVFTTDGSVGEITYQWARSDGSTSAPLRQPVARGTRRVAVTLDWNFKGRGALDATATLRVLSPGDASASASFAYACANPNP
jgi:hypothetical protein